MNQKTLDSVLRCYDAENLKEYEEFLKEDYRLSEICRTKYDGGYALVGHSRTDHLQHCIYFDGETFKAIPLEGSEHMLAYGAPEVDLEQGMILIHTYEGYYQYSVDGRKTGFFRHPKLTKANVSLDVVMQDVKSIDKETIVMENNLVSYLKTLEQADNVTKCRVSSNGKYLYLATVNGFYLMDIKTKRILGNIKEKYGIRDFEEPSEHVLILYGWYNVLLYEIIED